MRRTRILSVIIAIAVTAIFIMYRTKEFTIDDNNGPVITMEQDTIQVPSGAQKEELLAGITAEDRTDGDVTDTLIIENMGNFIEPGRRRITIAAFDSDNHASKAEREVVYTDYHSPRFSLDAPLSFPINTENVMEPIHAEDVIDGDISAKIKATSEERVDLKEEGTYTVTLSVSNSGGDVSTLPVTLTVYDPSDQSGKPEFNLSQYIVYTGAGIPINPWDYVSGITLSNIEFERGEDGYLRDDSPTPNQTRTTIAPEEVAVTGEIDYNVPGIYELQYSITDLNNQTGSVTLIVVVV